jgi:hypothetical protein
MVTSLRILFIPSEPDTQVQQEVSDSILGCSLNLAITCRVEIHCSSFGTWTLYAQTAEGQRQSSGGDEMYIRYEEYDEDEVVIVQAVARIADHSDGSYELDFVATPTYPSPTVSADFDDDEEDGNPKNTTTTSKLTVYLEYSNGLGSIPSPEKMLWHNGGYTHKKYILENIPVRPKIKPFVFQTKGNVNLKVFDRVFCFGDSTMDQFVRQRPNVKGKYYFQSNLHVGEKMRLPLNSDTKETHLDMLHQQFGQHLTKSENTALILGSCLWDILDAHDTLQGKDYDDHICACRSFLSQIQSRYPKIQLIWKLPMAVHIHWVDLERLQQHDKETATLFGVNRVKYMSVSRARYLYQQQSQLMSCLSIPALDLWDATYSSADQLYPSDGRHYRPPLNRTMLQSFYRDEEDDSLVIPTQRYFTNPLLNY